MRIEGDVDGVEPFGGDGGGEADHIVVRARDVERALGIAKVTLGVDDEEVTGHGLTYPPPAGKPGARSGMPPGRRHPSDQLRRHFGMEVATLGSEADPVPVLFEPTAALQKTDGLRVQRFPHPRVQPEAEHDPLGAQVGVGQGLDVVGDPFARLYRPAVAIRVFEVGVAIRRDGLLPLGRVRRRRRRWKVKR